MRAILTLALLVGCASDDALREAFVESCESERERCGASVRPPWFEPGCAEYAEIAAERGLLECELDASSWCADRDTWHCPPR